MIAEIETKIEAVNFPFATWARFRAKIWLKSCLFIFT